MNKEESAETDASHPYNMAVAAELRAQLARSGKKLIQVAAETGIRYETLGRYMNGARPIRVAALAQIAAALDTSPGVIMDRAQTALEG